MSAIAPDTLRHRLARAWAPLLLLALGMWLVPWQHTCQLACIPGDLGDARFNGVVLEHFYRWLNGSEQRLLSPHFFHPMPGASTFSDNHWGTAWIYSAFRTLGADRYLAFDLWYLTGFLLNFVVSHVVFRKMQFSPWASAVAAFAFTFALPALARHGHAQLTYRFLVPMGLLLWQRCLADGRWRWFAAVSAVVVAQFAISIYLGYFLVLLLVAWTLADALLDRLWPRPWLTRWYQQRQTSSARERYLSIALIAVAGIGLVALLYPYLHYARLYRFGRSLGEVSTMTPRLQSYLLADLSTIWGGLSAKLGAGIPARQEHQLFFGVGLLGLALLGALRATTRQARVAMVSLLLLFVLTFTVGRYSLYLGLALLPGVGAVRAVARIAVVMALPLALLAATAVDAVPRGRWAYRLLVMVLVLCLVLEAATYRTEGFRFAEARQRVFALEQKLPGQVPADVVVFNPLRTDEAFYVSELDAVVMAQETGLATLNGYSGNYPPGYKPEPKLSACGQAEKRLRGAAAFQRRRPQVALNGSLVSRVWVLGQGACATPASAARVPLPATVPATPADPRR